MRPEAERRRAYWVAELAKLSGSFGDDATKVVEEISAEVALDGHMAIVDHLRSCGAIPEQYGHDSTVEKLYSKYTDVVVSEALTAIGLKCAVIDARGDSADVQARGAGFSLVADAKAFRLSRTAKNQKDFKVQAMDNWRAGLDYALIVCPIYQLPTRTSQIYQQAIVRNVCILSYSHLAALVNLVGLRGAVDAERGLHNMLKCVAVLHPSKNAADYWIGVNQALTNALGVAAELWKAEKVASMESFAAAKEESLRYLRTERNRILGLSHEEALQELLKLSGLDSRIRQVQRIEHRDLLGV